jgi:hypothetical protein
LSQEITFAAQSLCDSVLNVTVWKPFHYRLLVSAYTLAVFTRDLNSCGRVVVDRNKKRMGSSPAKGEKPDHQHDGNDKLDDESLSQERPLRRLYRDPGPIIDRFDGIVTEAVQLMLTFARISIAQSKSNTTRETAKSLIDAALRSIRVELEHLEMTARQADGHKELDPCIYVMVEHMLLLLTTSIAEKYPETVSELGLSLLVREKPGASPRPLVKVAATTPPSPPTTPRHYRSPPGPTAAPDDGAQFSRLLRFCRFANEHTMAVLLFRRLMAMVTRVNDCRTLEEYTLIMDATRFSLHSALLRQLQKAQEGWDVLPPEDKTRSDVQFDGVIYLLIETCIALVRSIPQDQIFTLGDTNDKRLIPLIRIDSMASLADRLRYEPVAAPVAFPLTLPAVPSPSALPGASALPTSPRATPTSPRRSLSMGDGTLVAGARTLTKSNSLLVVLKSRQQQQQEHAQTRPPKHRTISLPHLAPASSSGSGVGISGGGPTVPLASPRPEDGTEAGGSS